MVQPFATVNDLSRAWPGYDAADEEHAEWLLEFVSAGIARQCADAGADPESDVDPIVLAGVTCRVVARMMQGESEAAGVTQESWGASPLSGSVTYANPTGDVYLTAFEKQLLGIDGQGLEVAWVNQEGA